MNHNPKILALLLCISLTFNLIAQNKKVADSLKDELQNCEVNERVRANILYRLVALTSHPDEKIALSRSLLEIPGISPEYKIRALLMQGLAFKLKGNLDKALSFYFEAAQIAMERKLPQYEAEAYIESGSAYLSNSDYENALSYMKKAIEILRRTNSRQELAINLLNTGYAYYSMDKYDTALLHYNEAEPIFDSLQLAIGQAYTIGNRALVYWKIGDLETAKYDLNRAITLLIPLGDQYGIADYHNQLGNIYWEEKNSAKAIFHLNQGLELAQELELKEQISDANLKLSELYEAQGNAMESLDHYKAYIAYRDSVTNLETVQKMADLRTEFEVSQKQHEVDQKESEITLLEKEKELHRTYILIAIFTVLSSYAFVLYLRQRLRTTRIKAAAEQKEHDDRVKDLLKTKETSALQAMVQGKEEERKHLAKELHNHLGSLLATVKINLNGLDSRDKAKHQNIIGLVDQATQDVRNISHELNMGVSDGFGLIPALEELVSHLRQANDLEILLSVDLELVKIDSQNEILLYRIIQELISNVLKHANATTLSIFLTGFEEGNLINILVEDDGRGFDPDHFGQDDKGMGLNSLQEIVHKLDGELNIDSNPESGTAISIDIALPIPENTLES